jgi:hypothetical protein
MLRALYLISYLSRGILFCSIFGELSAEKAVLAGTEPSGLERRSSSRLTPSRQPSETGESPASAAISELNAQLSPEELNERLLRTLEELLPPVWNQLGLSDAFADREQVLRLEDYTILVRRMSDVVAVFMGEREHESLLLLEFGRRFEDCLRRTLHMDSSTVASLFSASASAEDSSSSYLVPDSTSNPTAREEETFVGIAAADHAETWRLEKALVQRYDELCHVVAEMVSDQGIVSTMDPDVVSRLVWARLEA